MSDLAEQVFTQWSVLAPVDLQSGQTAMIKTSIEGSLVIKILGKTEKSLACITGGFNTETDEVMFSWGQPIIIPIDSISVAFLRP